MPALVGYARVAEPQGPTAGPQPETPWPYAELLDPLSSSLKSTEDFVVKA